MARLGYEINQRGIEMSEQTKCKECDRLTHRGICVYCQYHCDMDDLEETEQISHEEWLEEQK